MADQFKSIEELLKEEKDLLKAIVTSMAEGLLVVTRDYNIRLINPAAESMLGTNHEDALGKPWADVVIAYEGDKEIPFESRTSILVLNTGRTIITKPEDNHYYKTKFGKYFPVASVTAPIKSGDEIIGAVKVFRDASNEKRAKKEVEEKVRKLERLNKLMVGRELKMVELKKRLKEI